MCICLCMFTCCSVCRASVCSPGWCGRNWVWQFGGVHCSNLPAEKPCDTQTHCFCKSLGHFTPRRHIADIWATRSWSAQGSIYVTVDVEKHSVASYPLFPVPVELRSSCSSLLHPRARDRTPASVTALQPLTSRDLTHTNTHCECQ